MTNWRGMGKSRIKADMDELIKNITSQPQSNPDSNFVWWDEIGDIMPLDGWFTKTPTHKAVLQLLTQYRLTS